MRERRLLTGLGRGVGGEEDERVLQQRHCKFTKRSAGGLGASV